MCRALCNLWLILVLSVWCRTVWIAWSANRMFAPITRWGVLDKKSRCDTIIQVTHSVHEGREQHRSRCSSLPRSPAIVFMCLVCLLESTVAMPMAHDDAISVTSMPKDDLITITKSGRVRGIRYHVPYLPRAVDAYLGIPYAQPPLNSLRFRHPQPIESWSGIYNATRLPNSCYQLHDTVFGADFPVRNWLINCLIRPNETYELDILKFGGVLP